MYLTSSETKSVLGILQALNGDDEMEVRRANAGQRLQQWVEAWIEIDKGVELTP